MKRWGLLFPGVWEHYQETVEGAYRNSFIVGDDILHAWNVKKEIHILLI